MKGKIIAVTGAFGVLGRAICEAAEQRGATVARIDVTAAPTKGDLWLGEVDLADEAAATAAFRTIADRAGGLDALVNVAGGFSWQTLDAAPRRVWEELYAINVLTALEASRAAIPHLVKSKAGRIVSIGAGGGLKGATGMGPYAAAKSAVHRLTETLAEELKGKGVTANAILPSIIDTARNRADMPEADFAKWVKPEQIASLVLYLASDEAGAITGALIPINGGM